MIQLSWLRIISLAAGLITITGGAAWTIASNSYHDHIDMLNSKLSTYEKTDEWNFPKLLKSLNDTSISIKSNVQKLVDYQSLQQEKNKLISELSTDKATISNLKDDINSLNEKNIALANNLKQKENYIKSLFSLNKTFTLEEHTKESLLENDLILGLTSVYNGSVTLSMNNKPHSLSSGQYVPYKYAENECKLILDKTDYFKATNTATFTFLCKAIKK